MFCKQPAVTIKDLSAGGRLVDGLDLRVTPDRRSVIRGPGACC